MQVKKEENAVSLALGKEEVKCKLPGLGLELTCGVFFFPRKAAEDAM